MDEISAKQYGYESNKEVKFRKYNGIYILKISDHLKTVILN